MYFSSFLFFAMLYKINDANISGICAAFSLMQHTSCSKHHVHAYMLYCKAMLFCIWLAHIWCTVCCRQGTSPGEANVSETLRCNANGKGAVKRSPFLHDECRMGDLHRFWKQWVNGIPVDRSTHHSWWLTLHQKIQRDCKLLNKVYNMHVVVQQC